jgi:hypothetical protein
MLRLSSAFLLLASAATAPAVDFNQEVRPILAQHCFACHGMDEHSRKGKLRLDLVESAHGKGKSGEIAIVPGQPDKSEVIHRIFSEDADDIMPPPEAKKPISAKDKATLRAWIAEGGVYQPHWAFSAPKQAPLPQSGVHPIDAFVRARLDKAGLKPSPEADRYVLVRRVTLDLTGVPPTPEEADAFVNDKSPDAYEQLVDRLLASPRYGERWARRWLDLARYADTNGFEKDRPRSIWPYRDWVVKALNADLPYDQFSIKQLAGDLLPGATPDDLIATGFHRNTMLNEEGGADPNEYRFYSMVDRVGATGATWMGLTLNCAQCHTHKYDPILHTDYYSVMALLNNADEPTYHIPPSDLEVRQADHIKRVRAAENALEGKFPGGAAAVEQRFGEWLNTESQRAAKWETLRPSKLKTTLPTLDVQPDGFILGGGDITKSDVYDLAFDRAIKGAVAIRIEVASHPSLPNDGPGLTHYEGPLGGFFLSEFQAWQGDRRLKFGDATATNDEEEDRISDAAAAPSGQSQGEGQGRPKEEQRFRRARRRNVQRLAGVGRLRPAPDGRLPFRQADRPPRRLDAEDAFRKTFLLLARTLPPLRHHRRAGHRHRSPRGDRSHARRRRAPGSGRPAHALPRDRPRSRRARQGPRRPAQTHPPRTATLVMRERPASNPRITVRYHRGEYLSPREEVKPGVPAFLPGLPKDAPANRLTFARWLFAPENPLTARVAVNRQWQAFFGNVASCASLEDFGYQSEAADAPRAARLARRRFRERHWLVDEETPSPHRHQRHLSPVLASSRLNSPRKIARISCSPVAAASASTRKSSATARSRPPACSPSRWAALASTRPSPRA